MHVGKENYITSSMLLICKDTPRRVGKKAQIGFETCLTHRPGLELSQSWEAALRQSKDQSPQFFNDRMSMSLTMYGGIHSMDELVECVTEHAVSYSETNLPRGHLVPPALVRAFLLECHCLNVSADCPPLKISL